VSSDQERTGRPGAVAGEPGAAAGPVVVGIGPGRPSGGALEWAAAEAAARGRPLRIVHALGPSVPADPCGVLPPVAPSARDAAGALLRDAAARARRVVPDLPVSTRLVPGAAAAVLLAEARGAGLLVLGRRRGPRARLTRPLPARLAARAGAPVAVVPARGAAAADPAPRIVVGVDGSAAGAAALGHGLAAARRRGVPLVAVHAWTPDPLVDVEGLPAAPERTEAAARRLLDDVLRAWTAGSPGVPVVGRVVRDDPGSALVAASRGAALLVLGASERGRLGGLLPGATGRRVLGRSACPTALVPRDAGGAPRGRTRDLHRPAPRSTGLT
jgi:nucleotide-binding universal stress UspA family protein